MVTNAVCLNDIKRRLNGLIDANFSGKFRDDVKGLEAEIEKLYNEIDGSLDEKDTKSREFQHIPSFDSSKVIAKELGIHLPQPEKLEDYYPEGAMVDGEKVMVLVKPEGDAGEDLESTASKREGAEEEVQYRESTTLTQTRAQVLSEVGNEFHKIIKELKKFEAHLESRARVHAKKTQTLAASYGVKLPWHVFVRLETDDAVVLDEKSESAPNAFVSKTLHTVLQKMQDSSAGEDADRSVLIAMLNVHLNELQAPKVVDCADNKSAKTLSDFFENVQAERAGKEAKLQAAEKDLAGSKEKSSDASGIDKAKEDTVTSLRADLENYDKLIKNKLALRAKLIELASRIDGAVTYSDKLVSSSQATRFQFAKNFLFEGRAVARPVIALAVAGIATAAGALLASAVASSVAYSVATSLAAYAVSRSYVIYQTASRLNVKSHELPQTEMPSQSPLLEAAALVVPASVFVLAPYALAASIASRVALYTQFSARVLMSSVASLYSAFSTRTELNTMMTNVHIRAGSEVTADDLKPLSGCFKALSPESQTEVQKTCEKVGTFDFDKNMALNALVQLAKAMKSLDVKVTKADNFGAFQSELEKTIATTTARSVPVQ